MFKRALKEMKWDALLTGILYVVLGVMALALPETMEKILGYMIGVVLIVGGAVSMIAYLLRDAHQNYYHNDFLHGLIGIAVGILVLVKMEVVIGLISFLLGALVLASGCSKLQDVIDMKRLECGNWIAMLILAGVNVGFGVLLMWNPFSWTIVLFRLLGVGLIFSGVLDCAAIIYFASRIRKYLDSVTAVDSTFVEMTEVEAGKRGSRKEAGQQTDALGTAGEASRPETGNAPGTAAAGPGTADKARTSAGKPETGNAPGTAAAGPGTADKARTSAGKPETGNAPGTAAAGPGTAGETGTSAGKPETGNAPGTAAAEPGTAAREPGRENTASAAETDGM